MTTAAVYLDYNASAPLRPEARAAMRDALEVDGNASSVHAFGRAARAIVETARQQVADFVAADPSEVIFTSGATEANNWFARAGWDTVFIAGIEHDSLHMPIADSGVGVRSVAVDGDGIADVSQIAEAILLSGSDLGRAAITLQMANNETGVCQPVAETAAFAREHGLFMHTDAVQAAGRIKLDLQALGVDAMSITAHKIGGPKGIGALILRDGAELPAAISGGGQERRRRAGTENIAAIAGFGAAVAAAERDRAQLDTIQDLRDTLETGVKDMSPEVEIAGRCATRLANTSCIVWPGKRAETTLIKLDLAGIAVSAGAACSSGKVGTSRALAAMGLAPEAAQSAIRVSIGHATTKEEIARFLDVWKALSRSDQIAA